MTDYFVQIIGKRKYRKEKSLIVDPNLTFEGDNLSFYLAYTTP